MPVARDCSLEEPAMDAKALAGSALLGVLAALASVTVPALAQPPEYVPSSITRVVLLGTGTPGPDPERSGPCVAIVVNDTPYLVDLGPGGCPTRLGRLPKGSEGTSLLEAQDGLRHAFALGSYRRIP